MICLRERQTRLSSPICWPNLRVARISDSLVVDMIVACVHARTDEGIDVIVLSEMNSGRSW